jgi:hypothetical protein
MASLWAQAQAMHTRRAENLPKIVNNFEERFLDHAQFRNYLESWREAFQGFRSHVGLLK